MDDGFISAMRKGEPMFKNAPVIIAVCALGMSQAGYKAEPSGACTLSEVSAAMKAALQPDGLRVVGEKGAVFEMWLRKLVPQKSGSSGATYEKNLQKTIEKNLQKYRKLLDPLRETAFKGKEALLNGDLSAFGRAMTMNTEAQMKLHPELVGERARQVISVARDFNIEGYKVNGAGGAGGFGAGSGVVEHRNSVKIKNDSFNNQSTLAPKARSPVSFRQ
jgi:hypothetical protein